MFELYTGLDATQRDRSNNGGRHATKLRQWQEWNQGGLIDYSNVKSGWIVACACNGLNDTQTANVASDFFGKFSVEDGANSPTSEQGLFALVQHPHYHRQINFCFCNSFSESPPNTRKKFSWVPHMSEYGSGDSGIAIKFFGWVQKLWFKLSG